MTPHAFPHATLTLLPLPPAGEGRGEGLNRLIQPPTPPAHPQLIASPLPTTPQPFPLSRLRERAGVRFPTSKTQPKTPEAHPQLIAAPLSTKPRSRERSGVSVPTPQTPLHPENPNPPSSPLAQPAP